MYRAIIASHDQNMRQECENILRQDGEILPQILDSIVEFQPDDYCLNCLVFIITEFNRNEIEYLLKIQRYIPDIAVVLYNHSLRLSDISLLNLSDQVQLIIGDERKQMLSALLRDTKKYHWRRIPYKQFQIDLTHASPQMREALQFIEQSSISECNINHISEYIGMSPGYFSQKFKRELGLSFRDFMQQVLAHYEEIILDRLNLPAREISRLLGYSELSSFSRSFKQRKGLSPTQYKKLVKV